MDNTISTRSSKKELLALMLAEKGLSPAQQQRLEKGHRGENLPLSFAQERLWFLDQLDPGNSVNNIPSAWHLHGHLDSAALEQSITTILQRHEALRTVFVDQQGKPAQVIVPTLDFALLSVDLTSYTGAEREDALQRQIKAEARYSFDLAHGPLIRAVLIRLTPEEHVFLLTMHHIVSDGWSIDIFTRELSLLYSQYVAQKVAEPLPTLPIQYADYAIWQRTWLQGAVVQKQLSYWKQQLTGAPPLLELPTDRPRPAVRTHQGAYLPFTLDAHLVHSIKELSRREGTTLFMTLLAAFQILLARYSGQDDIVVGTPVASRNHSEIENLIGFFLNNLALRSTISGGTSFHAVLEQVRRVTLDAFTHQNVPFEQVLQELGVERTSSHTPLFQVFFNMQNFDNNEMALPGLTIEKIPPHEVESKFDLTLYIEEQQKTIQLNLLYNTDLFNPGRMEQMLEQYQLLLEQIVQNPAEQIDHFSLVTPTARQYLPDVTRPLSAEWYGPVFAPLSLHAQDEPQREAIRDASGTWSYKQLNTRSNQVAHYLIEHGVRKGDTVALYGYRSAALVCALIGILKAGAAVCILDPAYPAERLLSYLDALSPRGWIRIVEAGTPANAVAEYVAAKLKHSTLEISADDRSADDTVLHNYAKDNPQITIGPDDLAIISFTSGSTGKPKGVLGRHGPLSHFQPWQQQTYNFNANDRYSMLSGLSHDPLQREIFTPLWFGATICIPTTEERGLSGKLADWLKREAISIAHLTPAMMQLLVPKAYTSASQDTIPSLRAIFITGDMVTTQDLSNIRNIAPDAICVNSYGSTETQRAVANYIVPAKRDVNDLLGGNEPGASTRATVPVGQGIQDVQILILTTGVSLAGIGEVGEIYVRSPHLSAGYLNDDELTRQRFIHNPFTNDLSDRLYKTGDLGRYLPDGIVEVLGRLDLQAKIRGFRVELGEIEVALKHHPAIQECLAVVREDTPGAKRLVSYIMLRDAEKITGKDLYRFLKQKLPDYMLPAAFVELETLPVTPNGKIDRKALPAPELVTEAQNGQVTDTLTPFEEMLASIWEQALDRASVNREDNFFELGGHSLLAIQVISRVRDAFQIELPLRCLFDAPTIAGMAEHIAATIAEATDLQAPTIASAPRNRDLPLSFAQQRLWFLDQLTPGDPAYNIHFGLHLQGQLDRSVLERSLSEIVKRHEALRTTFAADGSRQLIANPAFVALPYIDLRERLKDVDSEGKRTIIAQVASTEAKRSFDLAQGPLFRSMLVRTESEEHILLLTMHHIVSDGWSINVLMKELIALYSAFLQGEGDPLAALPIQYADYAIWQRTWLQGAVVQKQLSYWKQQLAGAPPLLELPTDRPRPAVQTHQGAYLPFTLDADLAHSIKELSRREGTTLFMTLLAAFQILLARYSGQDDIVVGTPVASRNHSEIENLIGFFVNTLIIRAQFPGTHTFREALSRVREQCLSAYVHQDLPLERLVEELQPQRMLGVNPLFQVMFVMQDTHLENIELPGLTVNAIDTERGTARFDVLLSCAETPTGLAGYFEYNTDLFEAATIERMKNYLFILLEALVAEPDRQVADVSLLPADERHRVLVEWNSTRTDWPATQSINDLFEKQTKETPQAVAVMYEEKQQTYEELDQRANQLARLLQARGVAAETRVGIYMERSLELPTAIFGVLKAGGVYVPFDPSYPEERIIYMLRDAAITLIIAQRTLAEKLAQLAPECQIICLDGEDTELDRQPVERVAAPIDAENLAYILYTSGSTGAPKGTMITHRGLMNYLYWCRQRYTVTEGTGAPVHSSLAFDLTVTSLFSPLLAGRTVHLLPSEKGIEALGNACCAQNAFSLIKITPAHMALLSQHLSKRQQVHGTKLFVIGGEQLFAEKLVFLRDLMPGTRFINEYGPTETVVGCCVYEVPQSPLEAGPVPIGRPIANTQLYVLDQHLQPVPIGLVGELYIAGAGLARGYLHRPALTAERFIPHPFSAQAGERLYKTGDLVRYRPDGILEFLGRNDHQVKLRGFRTELGEIENVLRQHPAVHDTVVTMREIRQGDERLVAYAVLKQDQAASAHELRQFMEQKLPLSMVPTHLILLDTFPLTTNGKVDYRQLPAPETGRQEVKTAYAPPHTAIERSIAACWQDVLQVEKVGLHDNFFDLGGHSLLLTQVYQKLEQSTQAEITLVDLFQYPTISTLAEHIGQKSGLKPSVQEEDTRTEQLVAGRNRTRQRLRQRLQENQ